jgi:hypothetical protein
VRALVLALVSALGVLTLTVGVAVIGVMGTSSGPALAAACAPADGQVEGFTDPRQIAHAATIVQVGVELGVPQQGQLTALATAMQETKLLMYANAAPEVAESLNLPHDEVGSDADSLGLFQQRPSQGWGGGVIAVLMDGASSSRLFYERLLELPDWEDMELTDAAQAVQISAFPDAYAQWEDEAAQMLGLVTGAQCSDVELAAASSARDLSQGGTPNVRGGGDAQGPTGGIEPARGELQADCDPDLDGLGRVRPWVRDAARFLSCLYGEPELIGVAGRARVSDHPRGLAVDLMVRGARGDRIAECALANQEALGVSYVIWEQRINHGDGWERMADRGSDTENHFDHVHISFESGGGSGDPLAARCG